ncbi:unnamed protein product [Periconia digitata]|uniref:Uncharacterized protein n=1 Tax=Periconia digitata TaxID=1303443 RepID=A0A9W4XU39_9PLEO|nr:unnamed protein product [Periconia digitata]
MAEIDQNILCVVRRTRLVVAHACFIRLRTWLHICHIVHEIHSVQILIAVTLPSGVYPALAANEVFHLKDSKFELVQDVATRANIAGLPCSVDSDLHCAKRQCGARKHIPAAVCTSWNWALCSDEEVHMFCIILLDCAC